MYGVEPHRFGVTETEVRARVPRPLRVLHVADWHVSDGMTAPELARGLALGLRRKPDLICLTGDFVSTTEGFDASGLRDLLRRCVDVAPTFAVLGNHDGGAWLARLGGSGSVEKLSGIVAGAGVRLLGNESVEWNGIRIVGLHDYWSGIFDGAKAFRGVGEAFTLVLNHNPDGKDAVREYAWDLMLSGHTHGGQARIPGIHPVWAPVGDKRFVNGLYAWEGRQLFVTRGLGSPKHVRLNCPPELSILHLG